MKPEELRYAPTHEWAHVTEEGGASVATVGISAFAVEQLTDLVYLDLCEVGRRVEAGKEFGEVESVKAVSPLFSPVSGEVIAANKELADRLEELGIDPYGKGWLLRVRMSDPGELDRLLDHAAYQRQCAEEG